MRRQATAPDLSNVQGVIVSGYGRLTAACFVLLAIEDAARVRRWLGKLGGGDGTAGAIRDGASKPDRQETCTNIAFTYAGLQRLGLDPQLLAQFSREFQEGMCGSEHRVRALGDVDDSSPGRWTWGGAGTKEVHILLMGYADGASVDGWYEQQRQSWEMNGLSQIGDVLRSLPLPDQKEHFGFRDGIAQPYVEGFPMPEGAPAENILRTGEFLLGYPNEYGQFTARPLLGEEASVSGLLPSDLAGSRRRDFGRDGSYLVFRQLRQDVKGFWTFLHQQTAGDSRDPDAMISVASKMVGRWPSGAPLALAPDADDPEMGASDDFDYRHDAKGLACPLASHIRRINPRGSMGAAIGSHLSRKESIRIERRHRILRRGRSFGAPLHRSMLPDDLVTAEDSGEGRGLYFLCVNASIGRQFEFLQHAWIGSRKFHGLYDEADPLLGATDGRPSVFSIPRTSVRKRVRGIPKFVRTEGGGYFFLPSLGAIRYIANLD